VKAPRPIYKVLVMQNWILWNDYAWHIGMDGSIILLFRWREHTFRILVK